MATSQRLLLFQHGIGQGDGQNLVGPHALVQHAVAPDVAQIAAAARDPEVLEKACAQRAQALGVDLTDVQKVVDELDLARGVGDGLGDLVDIVDDLDAVFAQDLGKAVVLLLGDL